MATMAARVTALAAAIRDKINLMVPRLVPAGGATGQVLRKAGAADYALSWGAPAVRESLVVAIGDETTAIATGAGKVTIRTPYALTVSEVRASLASAQAGGNLLTFDVKVGGSTIFGTKPAFNNASRTSVGGPGYSLVAAAALPADAELTFDVTQIGDGSAKGLKITLIGTQP